MAKKPASSLLRAWRQTVFSTFLSVAALSVCGSVASAQTFPDKPVQVIVPYGPGGLTDNIARYFSAKLKDVWAQPVVVENKPGASATLGAGLVAKAAPDGYTLLVGSVGMATNPFLFKELPYKATDLSPLVLVALAPNVLYVNSTLPVKSVKELVDYAKKNPGMLDYGFTHAASGHMAMELFKQTAGIELTGIPYKGGGPMLTDLLGGTIPMMFINQDAALPHVRAGKMRAIAVSSAARNPLYPDVPTIAEAGYKGFEALSWSGMSVAKGTPQAVVDKLEAAIAQAMQSDAIRQRMSSVGFVVPPQGSRHYTAFVKSELDTWVRVIKTAGIKPE